MILMKKIIRQAFQQELIDIPLSKIFPSKTVSSQIRNGRKYKQILASIGEIGIIEAPVVAPLKNGEGYLLLDGHLRIMALNESGEKMVTCLLSTDDECYTYNKYISRLSAIQEHNMIIKALDEGVSEEKLAKALNLEIRTIRNKRYLLEGICPEAIEDLKDKRVPEPVFRVLKKMKPSRQLKAVQLMNDQNRFTSSYAQALLDNTSPEDLANKGKPKKMTPAILARQVRLEEESLALTEDISTMKGTHGTLMIDMTSMQSFLKHLLEHTEIVNYLQYLHPAILEKFNEITELDSFSLKKIG